jgi:hypothetical protein
MQLNNYVQLFAFIIGGILILILLYFINKNVKNRREYKLKAEEIKSREAIAIAKEGLLTASQIADLLTRIHETEKEIVIVKKEIENIKLIDEAATERLISVVESLNVLQGTLQHIQDHFMKHLQDRAIAFDELFKK